jgi:hypothetical protein
MKILKNKSLLIIFGISFGVLVLTAIIAYLSLAEVTTPLIIHFDAYKGIDFLGGKIDVYNILIVAAVIFLINFILAEFIFDRQRLLSYNFALVGLAVSVLILITILVIISVN